MKTESKVEQFTQGEEILHFVIGVSGFIMKELNNNSAIVYCWENLESANDFISSKFTEKQKHLYEVQSLDIKDFHELRQSIKFLPENAVVNVELYKSGVTAS